MRDSQRFLPWLGALARVVVCLLLILVIVGLAVQDVARFRLRHRGIESGLATDQPALEQPRFGVNVDLQRYTDEAELEAALGRVRSAGFGVVRQRFAWADLEPERGEWNWEQSDAFFQALQTYDLPVIAVLDTSPAWARPEWEAANRWAPPSDPADYAAFVRAFAERYGQGVLAYQIWDEPNIYPHWGSGEIDPAGYVELLRAASEAIRGVAPEARIIGGGLAPNNETGGRNMSDVLFLREIYRRGAGAYMDILGVKAYGFWTGPGDRRVSEDVLNFSRVILLREEMVRRGDAAKPVWALDSGWVALPDDWAGQPSALGSDVAFTQEERLVAAMERMQREWPWMGLMCTLHLQPDAPLDDPVWGLALLAPDGEPLPIYERLATLLADAGVLYPGLSEDLRGVARIGPNGDVAASQTTATFSFWGTDLVLHVLEGVMQGSLAARVDEQHTSTAISLEGTTGTIARKAVGGRVSLELHQARLEGSTEQLGAIQSVQVGYHFSTLGLWVEIGLGLLCIVWLGAIALRSTRSLPWRALWQRLRSAWHNLPLGVQVGAAVFAWLLLALAPQQALKLLGLVLYAAIAALRPDVALGFVVAAIPTAPLQIRLGPGNFSLVEISVLIATAARVWEWIAAPERPALRSVLKALTLADAAVALLVILSIVSALHAEYQRVALRELRVLVIEAALLYFLMRSARLGQAGTLRLLDVLWLAGVAVALYALVRYPSASGVIEAEGVRRARAFFGSPNNLALYLERLLPLGLCMGLWGQTRARRLVYLLGTLPVGLALLLTYSRGALLLGVPAALLVVAWLGGRRWRWAMVAALALALLAALAALGVERLRSLADLSQGTSFLRLSLWQAAWDMVRDQPWLGVGLDNFLYYYGDYIRPGAEVDRWLSHPHNFVLDFWLRLGIGGLLVLVLLLAVYIRDGLAALKRLPRGDSRAMMLGLLGSLAATLAHGSIDSSFFVIELAYLFMFSLAVVAITARGAQEPATIQ